MKVCRAGARRETRDAKKGSPCSGKNESSVAMQDLMEALVDGLREVGDHRRVDNRPGAFMAVSVKCIGRCRMGDLFSVAH